MKKIYSILFAFILFPILSFAQSAALKIYQEAIILSEEGNFKKANQKLQEAALIYKNDQNWQGLLLCYHQESSNLFSEERIKASIDKMQEAIRLGEEHIKKPDTVMVKLYKGMGKIYYMLQEDRKAANYLAQALELRAKLEPNNPELAREYGNVGIISRLAGKYRKAVTHLEKAIDIQQKDPNPEILSTLYSELGIGYNLLSDYGAALDYVEQSLILNQKLYGDQHHKTAMSLLYKGEILYYLKESTAARENLRKANSIFAAEKDYSNQVSGLMKIGNSYLAENNLNEAMNTYEQALQLAQKNLAQYPEYFAAIIMNIGSLQTLKGELAKSEENLIKALSYANTVYGENVVLLAPFYEAFGELEEAKGNYKNALQWYHKVMLGVVEGFTNKDVYSLPQASDFDKIASIERYLEALASKANCLFRKYKMEKDSKDLTAAASIYELFDVTSDQLRLQFDSDKTKLLWSDFTLDGYAKAIAISLELAKTSKDNKYKEKAFYYSEKSKGLLLLEAFQKSKAEVVGNIRPELLQKEHSLQQQIIDKERDIFTHKDIPNPDLEQIKQLQQDLTVLKESYKALLKELHSLCPQYYRMKYEFDLPTVATIQSQLAKDQALIQYFVSDSVLYIFKLSNQVFEVYQSPILPNFNFLVNEYHKGISSYFTSGDRNENLYEELAQSFVHQSNDLYKLLLEPCGELPARLLIIPAAALGNIPFESLLKTLPKTASKFKSHDYLLRKHAVSYCYSAALWQEMRDKKHAKNATKSYLGIAPEFGQGAAAEIRRAYRRFALTPLEYNTVEVDNIQKLLGQGTILKGKDATEAAFRERAADYRVIHIASHGMANDRNPDYSLIAFTEVVDTIENDYIFVNELYNIQLNADLVVLSACETGIGKLQRGEGIMSIARGFAYAGAKSILTTTWSVNDQATAIIIEQFYRQLRKGKTKDEALQIARLAYLDGGNDMTSHPYLWSPFIIIGDTSPILEKTPINPLYVGGGAVLVGFLAFGVYRVLGARKKERAA